MADFPSRLAIVGSDDALVLDDHMQAVPGTGNLARVRDDGSVVWRVSPDAFSQDAWTSVELLSPNICRAFSWEGWRVDLALATGIEIDRTFTK